MENLIVDSMPAIVVGYVIMDGSKLLAKNRKARFNYNVLETMECGISLQGSEVKSIKNARFSFTDAYARIIDDNLWLVGFHVTPYPQTGMFQPDPDRKRRLLAHKEEIIRLRRKVDEKGLTLVPLTVYLKRGIVKMELGVCQGKKMYDKRETIKKKDQKRDADRELRGHL